MSRAATALRWWVANAASWIAFGDPEPRRPEDLCSRRWPFDLPDELLPALRARAERRAWCPDRLLGRPSWHYRAEARRHHRDALDRLAREPGQDGAALAKQLASDLARMDDHRAAMGDALAKLTRAVAGACIPARGVQCDVVYEPVENDVAVPIEPAVFDSGAHAVTMDGTVEPLDENGNTPIGDILQRCSKVRRYRDVTFAAADVKRLWPLGEQASPSLDGPVHAPPDSADAPPAALPSSPDGSTCEAESSGRGAGGMDFHAEDMPLIEEMKELLDTKQVKSAWAAARHVAPKAVGSDHEDSAAKRLCGKFLTKYPSYRRSKRSDPFRPVQPERHAKD
jgi:hypothetical protein